MWTLLLQSKVQSSWHGISLVAQHLVCPGSNASWLFCLKRIKSPAEEDKTSCWCGEVPTSSASAWSSVSRTKLKAWLQTLMIQCHLILSSVLICVLIPSEKKHKSHSLFYISNISDRLISIHTNFLFVHFTTVIAVQGLNWTSVLQ